MLRHYATCAHCGHSSGWNQNREESAQKIFGHLKKAHGVTEPVAKMDYQVITERQCDLCLEPYVDDCTKCRRDFCRLHAGDIDGLCGSCI